MLYLFGNQILQVVSRELKQEECFEEMVKCLSHAVIGDSDMPHGQSNKNLQPCIGGVPKWRGGELFTKQCFEDLIAFYNEYLTTLMY